MQTLGQHIQSLQAFPPVQRATTFDISRMMEQMQQGAQ
jgi:hypothetical protein